MAGTLAVVDDDEDVRDVLRSLLESAGHTVRPYSSGNSPLSDADIDQLDLVITDSIHALAPRRRSCRTSIHRR